MKLILLIRISPICPNAVLNYAFGLTSAKLKDFAVGTLGLIPMEFLHIYLTSLAGDLFEAIQTPSESNSNSFYFLLF